MLLILLIPLQATFAMQVKPPDFSGAPNALPKMQQSDFNRANLTGNGSSFSGNVTISTIENETSTLMSDFSGNVTEEDLDYNVAPRDFSDGDDSGYAAPRDFSDGEDYVAPPDFTSPDFSSENCDTTYPSAACLVAQDLISLSPGQIRGYGLSVKPDYIIEHTLNILDPGNLTKVLKSISAEEISSIKNTLTPQKFDAILSKVPEPQHNELVNSISVPP